MATSLSYPHIAKKPDGSAYLERLPRIRIAQIVMDYLFQGWSPDEICNQHPHLRPAEVHSAMAYYFDHQAEIETEIETEMKLAKDWRGETPVPLIVLKLRAKGLLRATGE